VGAKDFDLFVGLIYGIGIGTFEALRPDEEQGCIDLRVLEKGLGLARARTDRIAGNEPWLPEDWAGTGLEELSRFIGGIRWSDELAGFSDDELIAARDAARSWLEIIGGYARIAQQTMGRGALGITALGESIREADPEDQACWFLLWAVGRIKGPSALREWLTINWEVAPEWDEGLGDWELLEYMRQEIPAVAEGPPLREFGAALKDPQRMERLETRLAYLRERHAAEFEAFFRERPEFHYEAGAGGALEPVPFRSEEKGGDNHE